MNKLEYAIKLVVKELLQVELGWLNFAVGWFNLSAVLLLSLAFINEHGDLTAAELAEMASAYEIVLVAVAAAPVVMAAGSILGQIVRNRWRPEKDDSGELWPEVEL